MAEAPVPDRRNISQHAVLMGAKDHKYVPCLGFQDNPIGIRRNGPRELNSIRPPA
jgi:hypothetical protein